MSTSENAAPASQDPVQNDPDIDGAGEWTGNVVPFNPPSAAPEPEIALPLVQRLAEIAGNTEGKFIVCGFPGNAVRHVANGADAVAGIIAAITELSAIEGANVYILPGLVRADLDEGRGTLADTVAVLALVADFDRHERAAIDWAQKMPVDPAIVVESSPGNFQCWVFLDRPYAPADVAPVARALAVAAGCDAVTGDMAHVWRVPGCLNYPNAKKIGEGRSPKPFLARVKSDGTAWTPDIGLGELRNRLPAITPAVAPTAEQDAAFDWHQRCKPERRPVAENDIVAALGKEGDRSTLAFKLINRLRRAGYSPQAIVDTLLDHADLPVMGHYGDGGDDRVSADVRRAFTKPDPNDRPASETFGPAVAALAAAERVKGGPRLLHDVLAEPDEPIREVVAGIIERGVGTYLKAPSDHYKSWLAYQTAVHVALGLPMWGRTVEQCTVVLLSYEDDEGEIRRRGRKMLTGMGRTLAPMPFYYWDLKQHRRGPLLKVTRDDVEAMAFWDGLTAELNSLPGHKLVIVDSAYNAIRFAEGVRNDDDQVNAAVTKLDELCQDCDATLLVLYHPSRRGAKEGDMGGAQAWDSAPRARLALERVAGQKDAVTLTVEKRSHGPKGEPVELRWDAGLLRLDGAAVPDRERRERDAVLKVATDALDFGDALGTKNRLPDAQLEHIEQCAGFPVADKEARKVLRQLCRDGDLRWHSNPTGGHTAKSGCYRPIRAGVDLILARTEKSITDQELRNGITAGHIPADIERQAVRAEYGAISGNIGDNIRAG